MIAVYFFAGILAVLLVAVLVAPMMEADAASSPGGTADARLRDAIEALRELEFEHETGKIDPADYERLRAELAREAVAARDAGARVQSEAAQGGVSCGVCGAVASSGAKFCTRCGSPIGGTG